MASIIAQDVPFVMDHPVYQFLQRQEALGNIQHDYWSTRPYSYEQIQKMFAELEAKQAKLSQHDRKTLARFKHELNRDFPADEIQFPWGKKTLRGLAAPDKAKTKPFFMSYHKDDARGWINWSETFRIQNNGKSTRGYYTDHLGIFGSKGDISFTTQFSYFRVTKNDDFDELPESYKEGYILDRDELSWINWDYPTSSLSYRHKDFVIGIHRQPVYWGYSPNNSSILSDNVNPLPHISWSTGMKHLRYKFMHARLSPTLAPLQDTLNDRRNLSAHRVEFDITPNFEFAFNEMIIYAHRDYELAYLNPVNFLFAEEHVQGDLDNLLMALEFKYRVFPGLTTYGSWMFDELNFAELFTGWWGNKFVFQLGAKFYPAQNLPSLGLEYTVARPWTYSHKFPINSYTSAGRLLGLQDGPNTTSWGLYSSWQTSPKLFLQAELKYFSRGTGPSGDPLSSYILALENDATGANFLEGSIGTQVTSNLSVNYQWTRMTGFSLRIKDGTLYELGLKFDW